MKDKMKRDSMTINQRLFGFKLFFLVASLLILLSSCAAESEDEDTSCMGRLNNQRFASVAADTSCSNYERGSAELGLAGFLFANFMQSEASDNFPSVFGLSRTGCDTTGDDALGSQSYSSEYQKHFLNAQYYTRTLPTSRSLGEKEISLFATLGELVVQTSCKMDGDLDGEITEAENQAFSKIDIGGVEVGTSDLSGDGSIIQAYYPSSAYLINTNNGECLEDASFDGIWDLGKTSCNAQVATIMSNISLWEAASVIISVESLQQLFDPSADANDIQEPFDFLSTFTGKIGLLSNDLASLGIEEGNEIYDSINDPISSLDNGGTCSNDSVAVLDLLTTIIQNAWSKDTSPDSSPDSYRNYNIISRSEISAIDTSSDFACDATCDSYDFNVRLIFKSGAGYTPMYRNADDNIKNTLANLAQLTLEDPTADVPVLRGIAPDDDIIALREILCME